MTPDEAACVLVRLTRGDMQLTTIYSTLDGCVATLMLNLASRDGLRVVVGRGGRAFCGS